MWKTHQPAEDKKIYSFVLKFPEGVLQGTGI